MTVPVHVEFSSIPQAAVFSGDLVTYYVKTGATSGVDLFTGGSKSDFAPTDPFTVFPAARMVLG
jgi:hypothetical protein